MSQTIELKMPDIGGHNDVEIIEIAIKTGDHVAINDTLMTLETDKATMDVPATISGTIKELRVQVGKKISEGDTIAILETDEAANNVTETGQTPVESLAETTTETSQTATLYVPDIGGHSNVSVIDISVKAGDSIKVDDPLMTLETDKATMDVPATESGIVKEVKLKIGDKVSEGSAIVVIETQATTKAISPSPETTSTSQEKTVIQNLPKTNDSTISASAPVAAFGPATFDEEGFSKAHASPSVRKLARELGVDLSKIIGTGPKKRILNEDVKAFIKTTMQNSLKNTQSVTTRGDLGLLPWPKIDFSKFGETEIVPLSRIKKLSGANLHRNWVMIPHVTVNEEADVTEMENFRKTISKEWEKSGQKLSPLAFIIKATAKTLKAYPEFNSSLDEENLILKKYIHIGFAADTPNGLVVPVIKNADQKGLKQIAQELTELSVQAREGKLKPADMQGASFTLSSLGGIGGTGFTPIINAPEVAILGVCKSQIKPVWNGTAFEPRLMCPLSLSFDHRVIDGAAAMRFTVYLAKLLADIRRLIL